MCRKWFMFQVPANGSERTELGLMRGHSYHMTDIKKVYLGETTLRSLFNGREKACMLRFRDSRDEEKKIPNSPDSALSEGNPFAYSTDVLTRLRSRNSDWQQIKDSERQRIGLNFRDPREFWMPIEDVVHEFNDVTICRLVTENLFISTGKRWRGTSLTGKWIEGPRDSSMDRSGGGDPSVESFLRNPQYLFHVDSDEEIIFQLLQFTEDGPKSPSTGVYLLMSFHIIKIEENRETRLHKLWDHTPIVVTEDHKRSRELMYRGTLAKGRYILVPTLYRTGDIASFLVRALSKTTNINLKELKTDVPKGIMNPCMCFMPDIQWATVLILESAELNHSSQTWMSSKIDPFCVITCEGKTVKTEVARDETHPEWNLSFIFYRKKPDRPILLKILNKNALMPNELIGECQLPAPITHGPTPLDASLTRKTKIADENSDQITAGTVHLTILTEDNLMAV
ncbi:calpain_III [Nesidiocoris tenuis]|nr:calpain_III [Nesidiocoris tenuis]